MGCLIQPFMTNNTEGMSVGESAKDDEISKKGRRGLFKGEKARECLRKLIPYYDRLGTFD